MTLQPSLSELKIEQHKDNFSYYDSSEKGLKLVEPNRDGSDLVHTKLWESIAHNNRHTLRIDRDVVNLILTKRGPHGRRSKTRGRPAHGIRHLLRRQSMKIFNMEYSKLCQILLHNKDYKSGNKQDVTLVMPDLSIALDELKQELISIESELSNHSVFKRMWAPCLARLIELTCINSEAAKNRSKDC